MKTRILLTLLFVLMFAGCESDKQEWVLKPNLVAAKISVKRDNSKKQTTFIGPEYFNILPDRSAQAKLKGLPQLFLRAYKEDETGQTSYEIYVRIFFRYNWLSYDATDSNGNLLRMLEVKYENALDVIGGGGPCKHLVISVSKEYLEEHKDSGLSFKLHTPDNYPDLNCFLPPTYIQAFLSVIQSQQK